MGKTDFIRKRKLTFDLVIFFQLSLLQLSLQSELNNFFKNLLKKTVPTQAVSDAALCKARKKCKPQAFAYLLHKLAALFYKHCPHSPRWKGFRLIAIDGTTLYLPPTEDIYNAFGKKSEHVSPYSLAQASFAYDPYSHVIIDAQIDEYNQSEQNQFAAHTEHFSVGDLILADRGYTGFWLMVLLMQKGCHFCIRHMAEKSLYKKIAEFTASGEKQQIAVLQPCKSAIKRLKENNLPIEPITVRLIRIELSSGETEVLVTDLLDQKAYPYQEFQALYHLRWPVEESYKSFKSKLKVENFSAKTADGIRMDFFAKAFMLSFAAVIEHAAQPMLQEKNQKNETKRQKHPQQINRAGIHNAIKQTFVQLFVKLSDIKKLIADIILAVCQNTLPIRVGRAFNRKHKPSKRYYMTVKPSH